MCVCVCAIFESLCKCMLQYKKITGKVFSMCNKEKKSKDWEQRHDRIWICQIEIELSVDSIGVIVIAI